jgi:hypothetical protein
MKKPFKARRSSRRPDTAGQSLPSELKFPLRGAFRYTLYIRVIPPASRYRE